MATTTIKKIELGDLTVILKKKTTAADRIEDFIDWIAKKIEDAVGNTPDWGVGEGGKPDNTLPGGGGSPDNSLPGGGEKPDQGLPGGGGRPSHPIAGGGRPGAGPDNTLPGGGPSGGTKPVDPDEGSAGQLPSGPSGSTKPVQPDEGEISQLPNFLTDNAAEIIDAILQGTPCAKPKR